MTLVKSMTGYGRAVQTVNGREFTVEIRSVNNRYLDCSVKLPRMLSFAEDTLKQAVKATISRGKVDVFVTQRSEGATDAELYDGQSPQMRHAIAEVVRALTADGSLLPADSRTARRHLRR